jgi:hypothetical protein
MASASFETAIPAIEQPQTYAFDRTATVSGHYLLGDYYNFFLTALHTL